MVVNSFTKSDKEMWAFLFVLGRAKQNLIHQLERSLAEKGHENIKIRQWLTLISIDEGMSVKELAASRGISKQAASKICEELAQRAYLCLKPAPTDARVLQIKFTIKGRRAVRAGFNKLNELNELLSTQCDEHVYQQIIQLLITINNWK
ncbi:helix-turn-helix domain-containing protein [Siphonobacter sp. SORGH_AS_0500]|uniref:MarR family winged helix-turn-helix transcriptional regulator n=1 Tax=Siphonobacter sp. SORGH_AS_0500 TaxID=1864824 RepID=UPI0028548EE0|nr:helix-turn-helix domain-containing protein [Siphonobacter sp. SORGH_AS_0500]MDR6196925.1 DNA-binding MarR family transcriptional regulator [Siphonobacter sp. SORGH_AS_0500]